jgi:hypothetical protein
LTSKFTNFVTPHDRALDSNSHHTDGTGEKTEGHGHKLYMASFFSFLNLVNELTKKNINWFGNVGLNMEGMPKDLRHKTVKLRWWDIQVRTRDDWTAIYIGWTRETSVC